jgi:hypothetical protein
LLPITTELLAGEHTVDAGGDADHAYGTGGSANPLPKRYRLMDATEVPMCGGLRR